MSQQTENVLKSLTDDASGGAGASSFTKAYTLAKYVSGQKAALSGVNDTPLGVLQQVPLAGGQPVTLALLSAGRTYKMMANGAITEGNRVYVAASGKIAPNGAGLSIGIALEAATADGDVIEVRVDTEAPVAADELAQESEGGNAIPFEIKVTFADGATADVSVPAQNKKYRVIDMLVENSAANGANANTLQMCAAAAGGTPITDAVSLNGKAAGDLVRAANITTANATVAANTAAFLRRTKAGGTMGGIARIIAVASA